MKRLFIIIVILLIVFLGMVIYRKNQNKNRVTVEDVKKVEQYISKIYMWKEITEDALPKFENINEAPDKWLWEVVKNNIEEYEIEYNQIVNKAKEIFGENFNKEFPQEGTENIIFNQEENKYYIAEVNLDMIEDAFYIKEIKKKNSKYEIEIIEFLEDYSEAVQDQNNIDIIEANEEETIEYNVFIKNLNGEIIETIKNTEVEARDISIVKEKEEQFSKKNIILTKVEDNLVIEKVE